MSDYSHLMREHAALKEAHEALKAKHAEMMERVHASELAADHAGSSGVGYVPDQSARRRVPRHSEASEAP